MKIGKQRGGVSAAVLDAPETSYASAKEPAWRGQSPAPAGALQRGYVADPSEAGGYNAENEDEEYRPRRGAIRPGIRSLLRSKGGRIVLGSVAVVVLGGLLVGVVLARAYLLRDPRFVVTESDDIQIRGHTHLTRAQLLDVFGGDLQRNIFRVSLADREADLERLPWVQHATVMRLLPNQLRVLIVERTPVAFARQGTQIGLVDANGVLLDMSAESHYSFPVLTGIAASDPLSTRAARMAIYLRLMKELESGDKNFSKTVSEVDVSDPDDVKAMIASGGAAEILVHFGDEQFLSRYNQFEKLLPEWKQQYPKLASADMRYQGQIVLEMRKDRGEGGEEGGSAAEAAAGLAPLTRSSAIKPRVDGAPGVVADSSPTPHPSAIVPRKDGPPALIAAVKKPVAKTVAAKPAKVVAKPAVAQPTHVPGSSAANDKFFAALAAQRKAEQAAQ